MIKRLIPALSFLGVLFLAPSFATADYCERRCWREMHGVRCQTRCWRPTPRYVEPAYHQSYAADSRLNDPRFILAVSAVLIFVGLIAWAATSGAASTTSSDIADLQQRTHEAHDIRSTLEADVIAARRYIDAERARYRQLGYDQG